MAKRRKFSRWRRLPGVYRFGDEKPPEPYLEPQRLTLYINGVALDHAEEQAARLGYENVQEYCAELVVRAIEAQRVGEHMAEVEAKRGTLEGLHEIADDPEYLAELRAANSPRVTPILPPPPSQPTPATLRLEGQPSLPPVTQESPLAIRGHADLLRAEFMTPTTSGSALVVLRHAGQLDDAPHAFLPSLRRGDPVPPNEVAELAQALGELEVEYRNSQAMDRRLTFALHRLAFESQILHTDAYPGSFDAWTVDMLRAVQESVERILSGQDIRYYSTVDGLPPETLR